MTVNNGKKIIRVILAAFAQEICIIIGPAAFLSLDGLGNWPFGAAMNELVNVRIAGMINR